MLKKETLLIDKQSGDEWKVAERTPGATVVGPDGKAVKLWVYVLNNKQYQRRFVYEHLLDREFDKKDAVVVPVEAPQAEAAAPAEA
jgi:hypothetical protein